MINPEERLKAFQAENNIFTKGPLSLVVQFTRLVQDKQFPLNSDDFQTSSKGQVAGLGGGNLSARMGKPKKKRGAGHLDRHMRLRKQLRSYHNSFLFRDGKGSDR